MEEAVRAGNGQRIDLVLCDIGMPVADGFDLIREIRALGGGASDVPVVAPTAYAREENRQRAPASGFQAHVAKPFDAQELLALAAAIVENQTERKAR